MAERKITTNTFGEGLIMDFAPDNTPNTSLSNALNATLLTYNGNEMSLLNDMGNGRVESAYLPEGYIPVGVCEFGDIIYIASYNPLINKSLIGCFPSPERNISNKEISDLNTTFSSDELAKKGTIVNSNIKKIIFGNKNIGPGDKFIISWGQAGKQNKDYISNFGNTLQSFAEGESYWPKLVKVHIVSIQDDGKLIYLDNDVQWYPTNTRNINEEQYEDPKSDINNSFPISTEEFLDKDGIMKDLHNLDEYRHALNCQYSVFQQKVSGKLALLLELESINNFNCGHKIFRRKYKIKEGEKEKEEEVFDIYFSASWDTDNYNINPSGIIITKSTLKNMSLVTSEGSGENITHYKDYLQVPKNKERDRDRMIEFTRLYKLEEPGNTYAKFKEKSYYTQVKNYLSFQVPGSIVYPNTPELSTNSTILDKVGNIRPSESITTKNNSKISTNVPENIENPINPDIPDTPEITKPIFKIYKYRPLIKNLLRAYVVKDDCKVPMTITKEYEETKEDKKIKKSITLGAYYCNPEEINDDGLYTTTINGIKIPLSPEGIPDDVVVNTFKRPVLVKVATVKKNELDENIKDAEYYINYTVCPCMPYGVLDHLAISNTIDFNKNQDGSVNLDTWKYYVNADSITLNYGLTTNLKEDENEVVEKVVMEFYDNQGLSASYEIKNQDTFDAKFTEYIELDKESSNYKILNTKIPENSISRELTELIPHAGEYAGLCVKDIIDDDHEKYVYFDKNLKVRSAVDLFDKDKDPNIATDVLEDPEIPEDNPTEISEGEEEYHASYTLVKTTSECRKSISYNLKHEEDVNTLENIAYIKGNIFKGIGFTLYKKEVFKVNGNSIKWVGETIPEGTKYYFILGKHGESSYTSVEFKTFMGFDASKLDFIIVYYYNLAGGINLYYTTVIQEGVLTECPIIKIEPEYSLTGETKQIKFSVSTTGGSIDPSNVTGANKDSEEDKYIIDNVKKNNTYNASVSVTTEDWITSIFFYFTVYTTTNNPVISKPDPVKIVFGKQVTESSESKIVIAEGNTSQISSEMLPENYKEYSIDSTDVNTYYTLEQNESEELILKNYGNNGNHDAVDFEYLISTEGPFSHDGWETLGLGQSKVIINNSKSPGTYYLSILVPITTSDQNTAKIAIYEITVNDSQSPVFEWSGKYLSNGDVQLVITPNTNNTNITYASMSISPLVTNERTNKDRSLIYTLKNPSIGKYAGTIYLKTKGYNIKNTFSFEIKSNSLGGSDLPSGIPIIKWQYPSKTFTGEKFIKFGVNKNNCNEYLTTLIIEDPSGIHTENLGKEFHGEKSVKINKHSNISDDKSDFTKVTVSITDYNGKILNSDSRKYVISLSDVPVYPNNAGILYYGRPYYVLIKIFKARLDELGNFDRENYEFPIIYQRWLWTAPIFNDNYTTYNDFKDCQFLTGLDFIGYLNGKKLIDQISSKILLPKCLMDNYPKDSEFKVIDSIGANVNIVGSLTDPNITFTGVPDVADSYGNSIFLSNESYDSISVSIGLGNKRVLIDDTKILLQDSDEEYSLPEILPDSGNPDSSVLEESNPIFGKDNFNLELLFKGYTPIKTTESYRYYDSTGLNIRERTFDMYTIPLEKWLPTDNGSEADGTPLLRLYGIKYNKMAARERILLDSYKQIRPIIEKIGDLEQYGLNIDNSGKPYYDKIPYLGFSEKRGGGTKTHLTCGYLEYTNADDANPRLYIKFYDKIDGNPFKGNFLNELLSKFLDNISTSLVQLIIVGRGCRIGGPSTLGDSLDDGVDGDAIRSPRPYRLTSRMGSGTRSDTIMGYRQNDRQYFPFPAHLTEDPNKTYDANSPDDRFNCTVNSEKDEKKDDDIYSELCTFKDKSAFYTTNEDTKNNFYTYTLLGIQDSANGFIGTADGGILKFERNKNILRDLNLPQNFAWSDSAPDIHKNKVKNYAQIVASLLSQIYVLSDAEKDHYILLNLVKLNKYNEAWRADILVKLHCNTEGKNSSKFINIIPKQFTQGGHTYVGINLFAFAAAAQYSALHPVDNEGNKISLESYVNSKTFKFTDENNINPAFSDLVKCIEFSYDLPYDLGDLETQCYNSNFASLNFLQNIYTEESGVSYKQIPVSLTLNADQLYVFNGGKFIPFNHGSNIYLIDKFVNPNNLGTLFGIISQYTNNLVKLELNRSSNIHEALTYDGARLVFKDITKLQGYDSKYTWILKTHGDNPELRDLANINLFNYGKLV